MAIAAVVSPTALELGRCLLGYLIQLVFNTIANLS